MVEVCAVCGICDMQYVMYLHRSCASCAVYINNMLHVYVVHVFYTHANLICLSHGKYVVCLCSSYFLQSC